MKHYFIDIIKYNNEYDYYINLTTGKLNSLFQNIVKIKTDKFYYVENYVLKCNTFRENA